MGNFQGNQDFVCLGTSDLTADCHIENPLAIHSGKSRVELSSELQASQRIAIAEMVAVVWPLRASQRICGFGCHWLGSSIFNASFQMPSNRSVILLLKYC